MHLKEISVLAEDYYKNLLENSFNPNLTYKNILNPKLIMDTNFLQNYINLLKSKGINNNDILTTLTYNKDCIAALKNNIQSFELVFDQLPSSDLESFFNIFFTDKELKDFFNNNEGMHGKLLKLSQLYSKDDSILSSLDYAFLTEQYQNIPNYKLHIIAKNPRFQDKILKLNNFEYSLYSKMTQLVSQKTKRWNRFELSIVENLSDGFFGELINDLYEQANQGNLITAKDIETLTFLFSQKLTSPDSNNTFNITTKKELEHFEEIKELVCDSVLTNPNLDDTELTSPIKKYLKNFIDLPPLDRMKLALLQKYYNMNLFDSYDIVSRYSSDIDNIPLSDEYQASIVEQIKSIRNIIYCNDVDTLSKVSDLNIFVETDLSSSTYLIEQTKEMFAQFYKESLYIPKNSDKIKSTSYNGKNIEIFDGGTNFSMIVKRLSRSNGNSQQIWNSLVKDGQDNRKDLRYYTCTSYMTDENLLFSDTPQVILGFANGVKNYSFDAIYTADAHSQFTDGDDIYNSTSLTDYMLPSTLETNTVNTYNEIIINTLNADSDGQIQKLQPDYVVYINQGKDIDFEDDDLWKESLKTASEFGIPVVVIDMQKVKQSEKEKIAEISKSLSTDATSRDILRYIKKIEHFTYRYGDDSILQYAPKENIDFWKNQLEQKQLEEKERTSTQDLPLPTQPKETKLTKQNVLNKQVQLKQNNIIQGEER